MHGGSGVCAVRMSFRLSRRISINKAMETAKLNIKQWAEDDRPREKLMQKGPSALSNAELLAILIGSGTVRNLPWVDETCHGRLRQPFEGVGAHVARRTDRECRGMGQGDREEKEGAPLQRVGRSQGRGYHAACELGRRRMEKMLRSCLPSVPVWTCTIISCRRCRICSTRNVMCF